MYVQNIFMCMCTSHQSAVLSRQPCYRCWIELQAAASALQIPSGKIHTAATAKTHTLPKSIHKHSHAHTHSTSFYPKLRSTLGGAMSSVFAWACFPLSALYSLSKLRTRLVIRQRVWDAGTGPVLVAHIPTLISSFWMRSEPLS